MQINQGQLFLQDPSPLKCGCYIRNPRNLGLTFNKALVPLRHIEYHLEIVNSLLSINLRQKYYNPTDKFLQVDYSLPINPDSSIYKFQAEFNNVRIEGVIKEKEQAKKQYNEAKSQGRRVAMGTLDRDSHDILTMEIGNIPPKTEFIITISMLQQIKTSLNTFYKVQIPSTISPRYMNKIESVAKVPEHQKNQGVNSGSPDFDWSFKIDVRTTHKLVFFNSNTHKITLLNQNQQGTETLIVMEKSSIPNKDFSFVYTTQNFHLPAYILGKTDVSSTVMLSFIPKFCGLNINDAYQASLKDKALQTDMSSARGDYIFFLDRSGSMSGARIQKAKEALILFLKSLPEDSYFNIISFGDTSKRMFNKSTQYTAKQIQKAIKQVEKMSADMGGTQIYDPLKQLLNQNVQEGYPRQVFLLTDGGVSNTQGVIKMVKKSTKYCRVHCIAIGNGASLDLIHGCANNGKGRYTTISDNQDPAGKIIQLLQSALTPLISKVKLDSNNEKQIESIVPNPKSIPYILKDDVINFFITFKGPLEHQTKFTFEYQDSVTKLPYKSEIVIDPKLLNFPFIDKMAHLKVLRSLENSANEGVSIEDQMYYVKIKDYKEEAIKYSVKHQVLSQFTAFICIGKQLKDGQYQQYVSSTVQKVHIEQPKPIQYQQQMCFKSMALPPSSMSNYSRAARVAYDSCDRIQSLQMRTQNMKLSSANFRSKKKSGFNLGIGNFFSSIGQKISNVFASSAKQQHDQRYLPSSINYQQNKQVIKMQKKQEQKQTTPIQEKMVHKVTGQDINSIVKIQAPNGSWNQNELIDKLSKNPKNVHQIAKKLGMQLVITQLVVNWIQKNHNDKQYALIVKKALSWIKKYCAQKSIPQQQLAQIESK